MNWNQKLAGEDDPEVAQALRNFKASVDAWSETAMSRPRAVRTVSHSWRLAASWALGCVVAAGTLTGSVIERQHQHEVARVAATKAAAQKAAQEQQAAAQDLTIHANQDLLANVDVDISRAVPAAMEPLAQLMDGKQVDENGAQ